MKTTEELWALKEICAEAFGNALYKFDVDKCAKYMQLDNWVWIIGESLRVPNKDEIITQIRYLFEECMKNWDGDRRSISSGGYKVEINDYESGNYNVDIVFEFVSSDQSFNCVDGVY
jgi:hypothetical protein